MHGIKLNKIKTYMAYVKNSFILDKSLKFIEDLDKMWNPVDTRQPGKYPEFYRLGYIEIDKVYKLYLAIRYDGLEFDMVTNVVKNNDKKSKLIEPLTPNALVLIDKVTNILK